MREQICKNIFTFLGELNRSAYLASATLTVQGDGNGGGKEPPKSGVPSSWSA
jgi:hypothetical protein